MNKNKWNFISCFQYSLPSQQRWEWGLACKPEHPSRNLEYRLLINCTDYMTMCKYLKHNALPAMSADRLVGCCRQERKNAPTSA